jgi:thiamine-monophosphate kinase
MNASSAEPALTVSEAGETQVLSAILGALHRSAVSPTSSPVVVAPGDDAAVLRVDGDTVVTSDAMVEGADFSLQWCTGFQLGWKLAATNLSDIAAMGATPIGLTVTVLAPDRTPVQLLVDVAKGLAEACNALAPGCSVVGGDLSTSAQLAFSVTAIGSMGAQTPIKRSGATPGDVVAYAGDLGLSGSGLRRLLSFGIDENSTVTVADLWREHPDELEAHLMPSPPIHLGRAAADSGATAMMDVSDSLSLDAARMGASSKVTLNLSSELLQSFIEVTSLHDVLTGGEDHGLLATFPPQRKLPEGFVEIGVVETQSVELLLDDAPYSPTGWDPFQH